jgi:hypothetical protein
VGGERRPAGGRPRGRPEAKAFSWPPAARRGRTAVFRRRDRVTQLAATGPGRPARESHAFGNQLRPALYVADAQGASGNILLAKANTVSLK